jgi:hypothetical protein
MGKQPMTSNQLQCLAPIAVLAHYKDQNTSAAFGCLQKGDKHNAYCHSSMQTKQANGNVLLKMAMPGKVPLMGKTTGYTVWLTCRLMQNHVQSENKCVSV